nr:MAG TPA: hypothetical protein [Bacteriophage sp.]
MVILPAEYSCLIPIRPVNGSYTRSCHLRKNL